MRTIRRRGLDARLEHLERIFDCYLAAASGPSHEEQAAEAIARVREIIALRGVEQRRDESLVEAFARALNVTVTELRGHLARRAFADSVDEIR